MQFELWTEGGNRAKACPSQLRAVRAPKSTPVLRKSGLYFLQSCFVKIYFPGVAQCPQIGFPFAEKIETVCTQRSGPSLNEKSAQ